MSEYEKVRDRWIEQEGHTPQCRICGGYAREPELCRCSVEGAILLDLIAELRAEHYPHPCTDPEDFPCCCESCAGAWPCLMADMADRAEDRLQKLDTPPNQLDTPPNASI